MKYFYDTTASTPVICDVEHKNIAKTSKTLSVICVTLCFFIIHFRFQ